MALCCGAPAACTSSSCAANLLYRIASTCYAQTCTLPFTPAYTLAVSGRLSVVAGFPPVGQPPAHFISWHSLPTSTCRNSCRHPGVFLLGTLLPHHDLPSPNRRPPLQGFSSVYKPKRQGTVQFAELLDAVAQVDPEMRIRCTSPHPKDFSDDVLRVRLSDILPHCRSCDDTLVFMGVPVVKQACMPMSAMRTPVCMGLRRYGCMFVPAINALWCHGISRQGQHMQHTPLDLMSVPLMLVVPSITWNFGDHLLLLYVLEMAVLAHTC